MHCKCRHPDGHQKVLWDYAVTSYADSEKRSMCGIVVWFLITQSCGVDDLRRMLNALRHRGRDDTGIYSEEESGFALGHNRLSIIALSPAGHQPMVNPANGEVVSF